MTMELKETQHIHAPVECVWDVLTHFAVYGDWNPFITRCECELKPGCAIVMQVVLGRRLVKQKEWIIGVEPGHYFDYGIKPIPGLLRSHRSHALEALPDGTCRYTSHFQLSGLLSPIIEMLMGPAMRQGFAGMSQALATRAEALQSR